MKETSKLDVSKCALWTTQTMPDDWCDIYYAIVAMEEQNEADVSGQS